MSDFGAHIHGWSEFMLQFSIQRTTGTGTTSCKNIIMTISYPINFVAHLTEVAPPTVLCPVTCRTLAASPG